MVGSKIQKGIVLAVMILFAGACGAEDSMSGGWNYESSPGGDSDNSDWAGDGDGELGDGGWEGDGDGDSFIPEEEEFLVQEVAATENYVFVPNQAEGSDTVALIDGLDLTVRPIRVGQDPSKVVAADIEDQGSVGFVLSTGSSTVAIVRADVSNQENRADVRLLPVPREVNQLAMAPDGRHVLAYIDPDLPINSSASAASLQTMALIRLGDAPGADEVFVLSVTRLIDEIAFTPDSKLAFVVGREGFNRIDLAAIKDDVFLPTINLELSDSIFSPIDQEIVFSSDGSLLVVRTSQFAGVGLFELHPDDPNILSFRLVELSGIPTDLDLVEREGESPLVVATIRSRDEVVLFDLEAALAAEPEDSTSFLRILNALGSDAGIGRLTPNQEKMVVFSTLPSLPRVGLVDLESETMSTHVLRNQIRNLAISPDSRTAVIVHRPQPGNSGPDWESRFRHSHGLTLWDLTTGYLRPVVLEAEPEEILMTTGTDGRAYLYVMLVSNQEAFQGVMRIDLTTHRSDFVRLPRRPVQLGVVGGRVFVSQDDDTGRITFFDIDTNELRTVSGYELNASIQ